MAKPTLEHLSEAQCRALELAGADCAHQLLGILGPEGIPADLSDPRSCDALQAWMYGFAKAWGLPVENTDAMLARFREAVALKVQQERTNSPGGAPAGGAGEGRA